MIAIYDKPVYILAAARTPIGRFNKSLSSFTAPELGGKAIAGALQRANCSPETVEMVSMGCVVSSGLGESPAKQAALHGGLQPDIYSRSIESVCGSAMEAIVSTIDVLLLDRIQLGVAGGMESRTNAPYLLSPTFMRKSANYARGQRLQLKKAGAYRWQFDDNIEEQVKISSIIDATAYDGLFWTPEKKFMREYALVYAKAHAITLEEVNRQAALSHQKARTAQSQGFFDDEIVPIGDVLKDDLVTSEKLSRMQQEAETDIACGYNTSIPADNGSAIVLCSEEFISRHPSRPMARVLGFSRIDRPAAGFIDSPVEAINSLLTELESTGIPRSQFEILEINEAFGIQLPVFVKNFPDKQINVNGGAIALGHPLGAAAARLLTTMLYAMKRLGIRYGITAICFGGGGSYALAVEMAQGNGLN
ncbi:thiolase family protein [candidate division KSB1 bacterium]|nr:thiolase family protein [candidate division KSB1 bacterium]